MKLLGTLTSPYARKARVVLAEKKIDFDWIVDSPNSRSPAIASATRIMSRRYSKTRRSGGAARRAARVLSPGPTA